MSAASSETCSSLNDSNISADDALHNNTADSFDFTDNCFICSGTFNPRKRDKRVVTKDYMKERILEACRYKKNEDLSNLIACRISNLPSLAAVKAKYHSSCYHSFTYIPTGNERGAHSLPDTEDAFAAVCEYRESNPEKVFTLADLESEMGSEKLTTKTLFKKLKNHYGDDITISSNIGRNALISYKCGYFTRLFTQFKCGNVRLSKKDKRAIIDTAANLIRSEIMEKQYDSQKYPLSQNFLSNVVSDIPSLLKRFMWKVITSDIGIIKRESIAHTIISAVKPRGFCSTLLLSVGTYIRRKTGSRIVIDVLDRLGFCSSYYNTQTYEASTILNSTGIEVGDDAFIQFVFVNTDHNVQTLDGHKSFHCLGGIAVYTPGADVTFQDDALRCLKPTASEISGKSSVEIIPLRNRNDNTPEQLRFVNVRSLEVRNSTYFRNTYTAYLWAKYFKRFMKNPKYSEVLDGLQDIDIPNIPSWRGFMEVLSSAESYEISKVICLPFITAPPSELPTLNTALYMAAQKCEENKQKHCFLTFDQPLYIKARKLVASDSNLSNVVVRLGGFHMLMSYFGAIGHIMNGSGLEELWSEIYAPLSAKHMMAGNAFGRAIRAHILTFTALGLLIIVKADSRFDPYYVTEIVELMRDWNSVHSDQQATLGDCYSNTFNNMTEQFQSSIEKLKQLGPTSQLWIRYFDAVTVALQFYEAERLGNWSLHLQSVKKMLLLFHASGHNNYAKCGQIYLQDMSNLKNIMRPGEFKKFTDRGYFTIRRSDKPFRGVWSDMTIEQTLNRSFGTSLKHGRGTTDSVLTRFYASMPSAFNIIEGLEDCVNVKTCNSEQHVELTSSRIKRDIADIDKLITWLEKNSPFIENSRLISLANGIIADTQLYNCHRAVEEGLKAMERLEGKYYDKVTMNLTNKVKNLSNAAANLKIQTPTSVGIDSSLIFQKLATVFQVQPDVIEAAFDYELSAFPLSLFDKNGIMRKTTKSDLCSCFNRTLYSPRITQYVIDGCNLLFAKGFTSGTTFETICQRYLDYLITNYGPNCVVVFDGYNKGCIGTKTYERISKRGKVSGPAADFTLEMKCTVSSSKFFENYTSKGNLVRLLIEYFRVNNIRTEEAVEDADALIVQTAIDLAATGTQCAVVGYDTDLLVLCVGLASDETKVFFCKRDVKSKGEVSDIFYSSKEIAHLKKYILFAPAMSGCDTTNAFYKKGKKAIMKLFEENQSLQDDVRIFYEPNQDADDLMVVARKVIPQLYKATADTSTLGQLRHKLFENSAFFHVNEIKLAELPPTDGALFQHVKRVYHQIQAWLGNNLPAESWGWLRTAIMLLPRMTDCDPAPADLMSSISCSCATGCKSSSCTCKKAGIPCSKFCKVCHGVTCENENPRCVFVDVDNDLDDDDNYRIDDTVNSDMLDED